MPEVTHFANGTPSWADLMLLLSSDSVLLNEKRK